MQVLELMTIEDLCKALKCSKSTIERELKDNKIAGTKIRGAWRFTEEAIADYIKSRTLKIKKQPA